MDVMEKQRIPFPNGGFEQGTEGWDLSVGRGQVALSTRYVAEGCYSLMIKGSRETDRLPAGRRS